MYFDPSLSPRMWMHEMPLDESEILSAPHTSGQELRRLRFQFNVAAPELAALVGLELESLMRYERGEAVLSEEQMTCLLNTFHELAQMMPPRPGADHAQIEHIHINGRWFDDA